MNVILKIWLRMMIISCPGKIKYATVATGLKMITYSSDSDEKLAARKEPITDTQTLKEPTKESHLSLRRWTHRHGTNRHRIWYHWARRITGY